MKKNRAVHVTKRGTTVKILASAALVSGIVAPFVTPVDVSADSSNLVDRVLYVDDNYESDTTKPATSYILIKEKNVEFTTGDTFRITMPSGAKWLTSEYSIGKPFQGTNGASFTVAHSSDRYVEFEITGTWKNGKESVEIPLYFEVDGAEGELKIGIEARGSTITSGEYPFAVVSNKKAEVSISGSAKGHDSIKLKTIRIDETAIGAMKAGKTIEFKLPSHYKWGGTATVKYLGAYSGRADDLVIPDERKLTLKVPTATDSQKLGSILIDGLIIDIDDDAPFEKIEVDISGETSDQTLVVGSRIDYTSSLKAKEPTTLIAGRNNHDLDDLETAELTLSESLANTWAHGRSFTIELPTWTKIVGYEISEISGFNKTDLIQELNQEIKGNDNEIELTMPSASKKRKIVMKFYISTKADAEGEVTAMVSGAGIEADPTVIAKVISPITAEVKKADVRTGIKNQPLENIIISETKKGALLEGEKVEVKLNEHAEFSEKPIVEVIEGDVEINQDTIDIENNVLSFDIESESRKTSKIQISGIKVDLDRTIPEGDFEVEIGGSALVKNQDFKNDTAFEGSKQIGDKTYNSFDITSSTTDVGEFNADYVVKKSIATVITPAEGNLVANEVIFKIGDVIYKKGDLENKMDIAPFIEAGRTYLPIRYVAEALGIHEDNIHWNQDLQQVTIVKDNRTAQLTVGSNVLKINSVDMNMDVAVKNMKGRTVLPFRSVAQALGAQVNWNESEQTITVK